VAVYDVVGGVAMRPTVPFHRRMGHDAAYRAISFERKAFAAEAAAD